VTTVTADAAGAADAIIFLIVFLGVFGAPFVALYFVPTIVGFRNKVPNLRAVVAINILLGWTVVGWFVALVMARSRPETLQADSEPVATPTTEAQPTTETPPISVPMQRSRVGRRSWLYVVAAILVLFFAAATVDIARHWNDPGHRNADGTWTDIAGDTCAMNRTFMGEDDRFCDDGHRNADGTWTDTVGDRCAMSRTYMYEAGPSRPHPVGPQGRLCDTGHGNADGTWTDEADDTCAMSRTFLDGGQRFCDTGHRNADGTWTDAVGDTCAMSRTYLVEKVRSCATGNMKDFDLTFAPPEPRAGAMFAASTPTLTLYDETNVVPENVTCTAFLGTARLSGVGRVGACRWRIPTGSAGKRFVVTATVVYRDESSDFMPWKFRVR